MDYRKHYDKLINRAIDRKIDGYTEKHHIVPRCMGGNNETSNLVCLTPEEHYVAHQLLVKIYPGNLKIIQGANAMANLKAPGKQVEGRAKNKLFGWLRKRKAELQRGMRYPQDVYDRAAAKNRGQKRSDETKAKISEKAKERQPKLKPFEDLCYAKQVVAYNHGDPRVPADWKPKPDKRKLNKVAWNKGKSLSIEHRTKISEGNFRRWSKE